MENPKLEVRVEDKSLDANGKRLDLDNSFFYAGVSRILNRDSEIALELKYQNREEDFLFEESKRIYKFLEQESLAGRIEVNPFPDSSGFPTIDLAGDYIVTVHR